MGAPSNEVTVNLVDPAPPTAQITATLQNPTTASVTWSTTNATTATINGAPVGLSGSTTIPVSATTTFTLVARSASGATATQSATVTVTPPAAPPTAQITASLQNPTTALVTWSTTNAASARINGNTVPLSGSTTATISATTTFTLVATSASGATATQSATVTVTPAPAPPPAPTAQLTATLQNTTTAALSWQTTNAVGATINGTAVPMNGSTTVPIAATTTFTLIATGASGATVTRTATVTVTPPPSPLPSAPTTMAASVNRTQVTLSWRAPTTGAAPNGYLLDIGSSTGTANLLNGYAVGNTLTISGEVSKGRYYARVRAVNAAGASGYSNEATFKVGRTLPTPGGFTVQWQGVTAVLSWQPVTGDGVVEDQATGYVLEAGMEQLHHSGFAKRGGQIICTYFDESALSLVPAEQAEGLYSCLDYYQDVGDPFSRELLARYNRLFPGSALFTAGSGSSGHYRAIRLWEAAVKEAGSLDQSAVIRALDHARIAQGPGGPAEMVPGQRHVRMNMYIARARNGRFEIVRNLGVVDPNERAQSDEPHLVRAI